MHKHTRRNILLWAILLIPYVVAIPGIIWHFNSLQKVQGSSFIIINKADMILYHYNYKGELLQKSNISTGMNPGNKKNIGDFKTPEGVFRIIGFEDASSWSHDFKNDSLGPVANAYGPYFIRLDVPDQKGIGIHGTVDDNSIGSRASEGCIRMHNDDLVSLVKNINSASVVVITPGIDDIQINKSVEDSLKCLSNIESFQKKGNSNTQTKKGGEVSFERKTEKKKAKENGIEGGNKISKSHKEK